MHIHLTTGTQWKAMPKIIPWIVRCLFYLSSCCHDSFLSLTLHCFSIDIQFLDIKALAWKTFRCWWKENAAIMHDLSSYDRIHYFCLFVARMFIFRNKGINYVKCDSLRDSCFSVRERSRFMLRGERQRCSESFEVNPKCHQLTRAETSLPVTLILPHLHSFSLWAERQPVSCLIRQRRTSEWKEEEKKIMQKASVALLLVLWGCIFFLSRLELSAVW